MASTQPRDTAWAAKAGGQRRLPRRFQWGFWLLCAGAVFPPSGQFSTLRVPADLVILASLAAFVRMSLKRRLSQPVVWLLVVCFLTLGVRVIVEWELLGDLRTLFGMTATYAAGVVFFTTRESSIFLKNIYSVAARPAAIFVNPIYAIRSRVLL